MRYQKMSGAGNTFIVIEGRDLPAAIDLVPVARRVCAPRHVSGGADGLIAIDAWDGGDFRMRYHNRDGSHGMMCGNGGRCAVRFAADHGYVHEPDHVRFTNASIEYRAELTGRGVKVAFPEPRGFRLGFLLPLADDAVTCSFADVGTPHAVIFTDVLDSIGNLQELDIETWGPAVRSHPEFGDEGANANFVEVVPGRSAIHLRTFERGVEAETGACGTGAISSAIIAARLHRLSPPIEVTTTSGERLWVDFTIEGDRVTDVSLEGGADVIGEGSLSVDDVG